MLPEFELGSIIVSSYFLSVGLAFLSANVTFLVLAKRNGYGWADLFKLACGFTVSAILGAKIFHVIFEAKGHLLSNGELATGIFDLLHDDPLHWLRIADPGYVFWGGLIVGSCYFMFLVLQKQLPQPLALLDALVPALGLAIFFGRIGCFLSGCCYGAKSEIAWLSVLYPGPLGAFSAVFPVQLFDAAFGFLCFFAFIWFYARKRFHGQLFTVFLILYSSFRFILEMLRGDPERGLWFNGVISTAQIISFFSLIFAVFLWSSLRKPRIRT